MDGLILIVDDQPQNLQMLSTTLREAGYQVAAANSGQTALRILDKRQPDLVLCDVVMPEMDGYEVCRRLKELPHGQDIPLMFLTAKTDSQAIVRGFESGAVDYVTKPFNTSELLTRVQTQLELKQARRQILAYRRRIDALLGHHDEMLKLAAEKLKPSLDALLRQTENLERQCPALSPNKLALELQKIQADVRELLSALEPLFAQVLHDN